MRTVQPAFICTICARVITEAHVPPTAPYCSSCGANTRPNAEMLKIAGKVRCAHCGHVEAAYEHDRCPNCDTTYGTFAARKIWT